MNERSRRTGLPYALALGALAACIAAPLAGCGAPAPPPNAAGPSARQGVAPATGKAKERGERRTPASLDEALKVAKSSLASLKKIKDYTCTFIKRERVGGELLDEERLKMKVRHQPFSVYYRFLAPESLAGQEAIYVEGTNDGKLIAHTTGIKNQVIGTLTLDPTGFLAMRNNRYSILNSGMKNLVALLIQLGEKKELLQDCRVEFIEGRRVDDRPCLCIEIRNPQPHGDFKLATARIWVDEEWNVPVRFESWEWPKAKGKEPELAEQYTYLDLEFDQGLTSRDFDPKNPEYAFP